MKAAAGSGRLLEAGQAPCPEALPRVIFVALRSLRAQNLPEFFRSDRSCAEGAPSGVVKVKQAQDFGRGRAETAVLRYVSSSRGLGARLCRRLLARTRGGH